MPSQKRRSRLSTPGCIETAVAFFTALSLLSVPRLWGCRITVLPLGKIFSLAALACIVSALVVSVDAPRFSDHFIDDVAFRAAWITIAQVPLVYLLATKRGPLNIIAALSYERVNWIHRWSGRMLFLSATTHMGIMMRSIDVSDIIRSPDKVMIVVRYGVASYGTLAWIALTSALPVRRWSYRAFYLNHWASTSVLLWVLFNHVPRSARAPIYASTAIVAFDRLFHYYALVRNNVCIRVVKRRLSKFRKGPSRKAITVGLPVKMTAPTLASPTPESTTVIRICNVPFSWTPGQHVRLYLPELGCCEVHPFTPATCSQPAVSPALPDDVENDRLLSPTTPATAESPLPNEMVLLVRSHSGLTRRLAEYCSTWLSRPCPNASCPSSSLTAYIDGPYGTPPAWEAYSTLVLVATSTGVSFSLSIMDWLAQLCTLDPTRLGVKRIHFVWSVRHLEPQFEASVADMLVRHATTLRDAGVDVTAVFYATCPEANQAVIEGEEVVIEGGEEEYMEELDYTPKHDFDEVEELHGFDSQESFDSRASSSTLIDEEAPRGSFWSQFEPRTVSSPSTREQGCTCSFVRSQLQSNSKTSSGLVARVYGSRPHLPSMLNSAARARGRESVMVAVCSSADVVAESRNEVAKMNLAFVAGKRDAGVDIFSEGFS
ncbi:hypothetical protein K504DRAFT_377032 [Pleomassaria siparia CBS 279.74]|uniref:FAD-binding FR-type domain-containing protein n=1 Tax=Pleomassaria siparia CBS 279.74 TaxID=1314801 RepID=A0A6G1KBS8_9PLEO|nr:hypothetical protein K504DRAFT_377032 [Pleomassaria siparia CBS 279.74]